MLNKEGLRSTYNLSKMNTILNYQLSTSVIVVGYILFFSYGLDIIVAVLTLSALLFSPYLIFVLKEENHRVWLYSYIFTVLIPNFVLYTLWIVYSNKIFTYIALLPFYFFFFLIRVSANEWLSEISAKNQSIIDKKKREEELKAYMTTIENPLN